MTGKQYEIITSQGSLFILIHGTNLTSSADIFQVFFETLQLPDYFGHNLDALFDMLSDLSWLPYHQVFVIVKNNVPFFENNPQIQEELEEIFRLAHEEQMENKKINLYFEDRAID